jgi:anti-anti-sigma regulatory factor
MELTNGRNLLVERPAPGVWVGRFTRPDPREQLDGAGIEDCDLYQDLASAVLGGLAAGDALVLNFALVYWFPTSFYQVLLQVRAEVLKKGARLLLCGFTPEAQESVRLFKGDHVFEITHTEEQAVRKATSCHTTSPVREP